MILQQDTSRQSAQVSKRFRQMLLASTMCGAAIALPNVANAAQHQLDDPQNTTQSITDTGATVDITMTSDFSVVTSGTALDINGDGDIIYNDLNSSSLTGSAVGLDIRTGVANTSGSITVDTGGDITGGTGIYALNIGMVPLVSPPQAMSAG